MRQSIVGARNVEEQSSVEASQRFASVSDDARKRRKIRRHVITLSL